MDGWIELRCEGKMHGQLNPQSLTLVTARGDWVYVYDLAATVRERRPVVTRLRATEYNTTSPQINGEMLPVTGRNGD
ncbi:MAG TPA: hypothetical protein PKA43_00110 [Candidatus Competibacter phosphatis]|nr:hypothetical protein [Candidatus Competibacter phosphatis]